MSKGKNNTAKNELLKSLTEGLDQSKSERIRMLLDIADVAVTEEERGRALNALAECLLRTSATAEPLRQKKARGSSLQKHREYVARQIMFHRTMRGWTQAQLAEASGLPQPHISRIETGVLAPTYLTISKIAKALGVRMDQIDPGFSHEDE